MYITTLLSLITQLTIMAYVLIKHVRCDYKLFFVSIYTLFSNLVMSEREARSLEREKEREREREREREIKREDFRYTLWCTVNRLASHLATFIVLKELLLTRLSSSYFI